MQQKSIGAFFVKVYMNHWKNKHKYQYDEIQVKQSSFLFESRETLYSIYSDLQRSLNRSFGNYLQL